MTALFRQMWVKAFHLEGKLFRSLRDVFVPGKIAVEFFKGKQKRYPPPVQFLFVVMFFFLFVFTHFVGTNGIRFQANRSGVRMEEQQEERIDFYEAGRRYAEMKRMQATFDSLPAALRTPEARQAFDSMMQHTHGDAIFRFSRALAQSDPSAAGKLDSITLNLGVRSIKVATADMFQLEADAIIEKYRLESWIDKLSIRQGVKTMKAPDALVRTYLGSLVWTILALVALLSLLLGLLYWRQKRYYVEHFVFLLYQHTALFLALTLLICINHFLPLSFWMWILVLLWMALGPFLAMKRFYSQGLWTTFWKWSLFSLIYIAGFALLFTMGILVVFFFF